MGFFDSLFTSERQNAAQDEWGSEKQSYDDLINQINAMQSSYNGVNSLGDMNKTFGLKQRTAKDVSSTFNPARRNLATQNALARKRVAARMTGSNASPEVDYGNVDASFAPAFGNLESEAAQTGLNVERQDEQFGANMLSDIFGKKDTYGFNKKSTQLAGLSGRSAALKNYLDSLSGTSPFEDVLSVAGTASKFINPLSSLTSGATDYDKAVSGLNSRGIKWLN
jgi:hypothetical protein